MAKARRHTKTTTDTILRKLEDARKQFERTFERAIKAVQAEGSTGVRRSSKAASSRSRTAVQKPSTGKGRAAPVQTAIAKVLSKRRTGMTMEPYRLRSPTSIRSPFSTPRSSCAAKAQ